MQTVRIEFTVPKDTYEQIEQARGDVPRAAWIKRLIERAIADEMDPTEFVRRRKPPVTKGS